MHPRDFAYYQPPGTRATSEAYALIGQTSMTRRFTRIRSVGWKGRVGVAAERGDFSAGPGPYRRVLNTDRNGRAGSVRRRDPPHQRVVGVVPVGLLALRQFHVPV